MDAISAPAPAVVWKIYKITHYESQKLYIGMTYRDVKERWREHCEPGHDDCQRLKNAIRKYGPEAFHVEQIASAKSIEDANELEIATIAQYQSDDRNVGFNILRGGNGRRLRFCKNGHDMDLPKGRRGNGCAVCHSAAMAAWYQNIKKDPEKAAKRRRDNSAAARRLYAEKKSDSEYRTRIRAAARAYAEKNRDALNAYQSEWVKANPEKVREYKRKARNNNLEHYRKTDREFKAAQRRDPVKGEKVRRVARARHKKKRIAEITAKLTTELLTNVLRHYGA